MFDGKHFSAGSLGQQQETYETGRVSDPIPGPLRQKLQGWAGWPLVCSSPPGDSQEKIGVRLPAASQ